MSGSVKLPVGIENFEEIRTNGYYYVDKTNLIEQLFESRGKVNLFTRPRRFGKTLNMSMLKYFFEIGADPSLFDGLNISRNEQLCKEHMGKYPVIFLTLKNVDGLDFQEAKQRFVDLIGTEAARFRFLLDSDRLTLDDKERYKALIAIKNGAYFMSNQVFTRSLKTLSELLNKYYDQKTVILIDEYDVPLDKAFQQGYYREMVSLIRGIFGDALKTNDSLSFAVMTGCLRISKESIFTGLNNFKILSITDVRFDEQFGFTDKEVNDILSYYHMEDRMKETKQWYDGYHFGNVDVYCPWDVINHVDRIKDDPGARPETYWINTSGNDLVKHFIEKADRRTKDEIERLVAGEVIEKEVRLELTYDEIDNSIENLWSVLFTTGYLTQAGKAQRGIYRLKIPNEEVREVYQYQIKEWLNRTIRKNEGNEKPFWKSFEEGNSAEVEEYLTKMLGNSISVFDTKGQKGERENSYHMLLVGLLACNPDWYVKSNVEAGEGFADIIVEMKDPRAGAVVELKYSQTVPGMEKACENAIAQIKSRRYEEYLRNDGREDIIFYGIAFYKKRCKVVVERAGE